MMNVQRLAFLSASLAGVIVAFQSGLTNLLPILRAEVRTPTTPVIGIFSTLPFIETFEATKETFASGRPWEHFTASFAYRCVSKAAGIIAFERTKLMAFMTRAVHECLSAIGTLAVIYNFRAFSSASLSGKELGAMNKEAFMGTIFLRYGWIGTEVFPAIKALSF